MKKFSSAGEAKVMMIGEKPILAIGNESGESLAVDLTIEQLKALVREAAEILSHEYDSGVERTQYFNGDVQYTVS